jgi:GIY-YIG catalytic domain-containing protein
MPRVNDAIVAAAVGALSAPGKALNDGGHVPPSAGLYAVHADPSVWNDLALGTPPDARPLYVGKAEHSLVSRDIMTHFSSGKTGSSTLRRSLAALLRERLRIRACPRNPEHPDGSANFGLEPDSDDRITQWMRDNLRLSVWSRDVACDLDALETDVLTTLQPPLNLSKIKTDWTGEIKRHRAVLAAEARAWQQMR